MADPSDPVAGLLDFPMPPPIGLWPQTPLAWAAIAAAIVISWLIARRWRLNGHRREARLELDRIVRALEAGGPPQALAARLAVLVRRAALAAYPRDEVAPRVGPAWLTFLDRSCREPAFSQGAGRLIASLPYRRDAPSREDVRTLASLARRWIGGRHV